MKANRKRIKAYRELIQKEYVRDAAVRKTVESCDALLIREENCRVSYFEFLYDQSRFLKKRWWGLQALVLLLLWLLLMDNGNSGDMGRVTGILATVFVVLIIPEVWKNQRYSVMEIEGAAFYSLRQICTARILLFAVVDIVMVTVFFAVSFYTVQIAAYRMITDFLVPFNITGCICFKLLSGRKGEAEYVALLVSGVWIVIWTAVVLRDEIYRSIVEPVWLGLLLLSFGFFVFCVIRSQRNCGNGWEEFTDGIGT